MDAIKEKEFFIRVALFDYLKSSRVWQELKTDFHKYYTNYVMLLSEGGKQSGAPFDAFIMIDFSELVIASEQLADLLMKEPKEFRTILTDTLLEIFNKLLKQCPSGAQACHVFNTRLQVQGVPRGYYVFNLKKHPVRKGLSVLQCVVYAVGKILQKSHHPDGHCGTLTKENGSFSSNADVVHMMDYRILEVLPTDALKPRRLEGSLFGTVRVLIEGAPAQANFYAGNEYELTGYFDSISQKYLCWNAKNCADNLNSMNIV